MSILEKTILSKESNEKEIVDTILKYGFAIMPAYFSLDELAKIRLEHKNVFALEEPLADIVDFGNGELAQVKRTTLEKNKDKFSYLLKEFCSPFVVKIVKRYFKNFNIEIEDKYISHQFEVEHDYKEGKSSGSNLHFDRVPAFKMCLYLDDTTKDNGALRVVPQTQFMSRDVSIVQYAKNTNPLYQKNFVLKEEVVQAHHIEGKAGSVIFLDTFCLHGGGNLSKENTRKTIRGVSWARPLNSSYFEYASDFKGKPKKKFEEIEFYHPNPVSSGIQIDNDVAFQK